MSLYGKELTDLLHNSFNMMELTLKQFYELAQETLAVTHRQAAMAQSLNAEGLLKVMHTMNLLR